MHGFRGVVVVGLALLLGCTTYRDQLGRAQQSFEQSEHDRTLALLRDLESDVKHLSVPEQAEYAYLRGITDYRVGYKPDARHWLAVAKAYDDNSPGVLAADWKTRTMEALADLNDVVYVQGTSALVASRRSDDDIKKDDANDPKRERDAKKNVPAEATTQRPADPTPKPSDVTK